MVDQLKPLGPQGRLDQVIHFHSRERRKSHLDPALGLFQTHSFGTSDTAIDTGVRFPVRSRPITFSVDVRRSGSPNGIVLELGDSTTGLALWLDGATVGFTAGDAAGDQGVLATADNVLMADGQLAKFTFGVVPGSGVIALWNRSSLIAYAQSAAMSMNNGWASSALGAIGEINGTVTTRVPLGQRQPLTGASIAKGVRSFQGQVPRQFLGRFLEAPEIPLIPLVPPDSQGSFSDSFSESFSGGFEREET